MPSLDWIGKKAVVEHHKQVPFHLLRCNDALSVGEPGSGNLLVQGDNLLALKALLPYYAGQVKCIYIDPPYNTGNEGWIYNDNVNSPEMRDWLGRAVGKEAEDLSRHDKWLCMMYPRLALLREFLSDDGGVIFVSIDDYEYHRLRMLMDEIFMPNRWIGTLIWKRRQTPDSRNLNGVSTDHEYVLCYSKAGNVRFKGQAKDLTKYSNPDNDSNGPWMSDNLTGLAGPLERPNLHYNVVNPATGKSYPPHPTRGWIYGPERMNELIQEGKILWPKSDSGRPRLKRFLSDMKSETTGFSTFLNAPANIEGTRAINAILGEKVFAFPKPPGLVSILVDQVTDKESLVLDSFAGSGTTGQAVLTINKEDGGNRRFILVEMDKDICQSATAVRLTRTIQGYKGFEALGGGFRFCDLGEPLFSPAGTIEEDTVSFKDLAHHVFFIATGEPLPHGAELKTPRLGVSNGVAVYLLYNGILGDKSVNGGNVLTREILASLPPHDGTRIIYGNGCRIGAERLRRENIIFRQIPYEVRVS